MRPHNVKLSVISFSISQLQAMYLYQASSKFGNKRHLTAPEV